MYVQPEELKRLIGRFQGEGQLSPELVKVLDRIITGLAGRYGYSTDLDDKRQEFFLKVMEKRDAIRQDRNVFGYLTAIAVNILRRRPRKFPLLETDITPAGEDGVLDRMPG